MGDMYSLSQQEHNGQPPQDEQEFRSFLASKQDALDRLNLSVDAMFQSPRNGEPLAWVYGTRPPTGPNGAYLGYEINAVNGKRLVIGLRGMHEEMDEAQFNKLFTKRS
jgi:hypothetical protein